MLSHGSYKVDGTELVDGVQALKLISTSPDEQGLPSAPVFWVDPSTYLPVRDLSTMGADASVQVDFKWLQSTKANLADLSVVIPSGFTQVPAPQGSSASPSPGPGQ